MINTSHEKKNIIEKSVSIREKRITWLIPTYNEEASIQDVIKSIPIGVPYVLDRSEDKTPIIAKEAGAIVIHRTGKGKGEAVKEGIERLKPISDIIILIDGDNTYSPYEVYSLLEALENGADMAIGSRMLGKQQKGSMGIINKLGNLLLNFSINTFFDVSLTDFLSGFRSFYSKKLDSNEIYSKGFDIEVELTTSFLRKGLKIVEVPITYSPRVDSSNSKLNIFIDGIKILYMIFLQWIRSSRKSDNNERD